MIRTEVSHPLIIGLLGDMCSGKETLVNYLIEYHGFSAVSNIKLTKEELLNRKMDEFSLRSVRATSSIKSKIRSQDSIYTVVSPYLSEEDYYNLSNKSCFKLLNLVCPAKSRYEFYMKKNPDSNFQEFLERDSVISTDKELSNVRSEALFNIQNDSTLEDLKSKMDYLIAQFKQCFRPSWDDYFMSVAQNIAERSNCMKQKVGTVIVKDKRIVAAGYNGTPSGIPNCFEGGCERCNINTEQGLELDKCFCIHSEENAVIEVGRQNLKDCTLFATTHPCIFCAKIIIAGGIKRVIYDKEYNSEYSKYLFDYAGVETIKWFKKKKNI
jgi:dCMP deaminase